MTDCGEGACRSNRQWRGIHREAHGNSLLADRITQAYTDERFAAYAPTAIYIIKMGETCRPYINKERAAFGLGPQ